MQERVFMWSILHIRHFCKCLSGFVSFSFISYRLKHIYFRFPDWLKAKYQSHNINGGFIDKNKLVYKNINIKQPAVTLGSSEQNIAQNNGAPKLGKRLKQNKTDTKTVMSSKFNFHVYSLITNRLREQFYI